MNSRIGAGVGDVASRCCRRRSRFEKLAALYGTGSKTWPMTWRPPAPVWIVDVLNHVVLDGGVQLAAAVLRADDARVGDRAVLGDVVEQVVLRRGDVRRAVVHQHADVVLGRHVDGLPALKAGVLEDVAVRGDRAADDAGQRAGRGRRAAAATVSACTSRFSKVEPFDIERHVRRAGVGEEEHRGVVERVVHGAVVELEQRHVGVDVVDVDAVARAVGEAGEQAVVVDAVGAAEVRAPRSRCRSESSISTPDSTTLLPPVIWMVCSPSVLVGFGLGPRRSGVAVAVKFIDRSVTLLALVSATPSSVVFWIVPPEPFRASVPSPVTVSRRRAGAVEHDAVGGSRRRWPEMLWNVTPRRRWSCWRR